MMCLNPQLGLVDGWMDGQMDAHYDIFGYK